MEKKVVSRRVIIALGIVCIVLLALLVGNVYTLSSQISSLHSQVESLENENLSLKSEMSTRDNTITSLNSQIVELQVQRDKLQTWLEGNITMLNSLRSEKEMLLLWLEGNKTLLAQTQTWLQENITYYTSRVNSLNSQIANLQNQISSLNARISTLQAYVNAYQNLRDKVNYRWTQINVEPFITPQDQAVRDIVYSITGGWSNPSDWDECWEDIKAMYDWVVDNIDYRSDGLYPILPEDPSDENFFGCLRL